MPTQDPPKTRFDLVSPGVGRASGGIVTLLLGGVMTGLGFVTGMEFLKQAGFSMLLMGLVLIGVGAFRVYTGMHAKTRSIKCPHCGEVNQILADVTSFPCFNCEKPLKLASKRG